MKRETYLGYPLTDWYLPTQKPVRKGLYIVGSNQLSVMLEWNGKEWVNGYKQPFKYQNLSWRGVKR